MLTFYEFYVAAFTVALPLFAVAIGSFSAFNAKLSLMQIGIFVTISAIIFGRWYAAPFLALPICSHLRATISYRCLVKRSFVPCSQPTNLRYLFSRVGKILRKVDSGESGRLC
jgi:hypothetical protein